MSRYRFNIFFFKVIFLLSNNRFSVGFVIVIVRGIVGSRGHVKWMNCWLEENIFTFYFNISWLCAIWFFVFIEKKKSNTYNKIVRANVQSKKQNIMRAHAGIIAMFNTYNFILSDWFFEIFLCTISLLLLLFLFLRFYCNKLI